MHHVVNSFTFLLIIIFVTACGGGGSAPAPNSAPTASNVSITDNNYGTVLVGDVLTGNYTYTDSNSDTEGASTFRWLRDGIVINGATSQNYLLVSEDSGPSITFEVTPIATAGATTGSSVNSTGITVNSAAPTADGVTITDNNGGMVLVGDILTANYIYADADSDAEGTSTFRWLRNGTVINGAISAMYTLVNADSGQSISFEITPTAVTGSAIGSAVISNSVVPKNSIQVSWNSNPETAVNRSAGGYKVYYSTSTGFNIGDGGVTVVDIPYVSGATAPTSVQLEFFPGTYYIRIAAYSSLNAPGAFGGSISTATTQITLSVP